MIEQGSKLEMLPVLDPELERSLAAYEWVNHEVPKHGYSLVLTPTTEFEIYSADQVRVGWTVTVKLCY